MRLGSNLLLPRQFMAGLYLLISFFFSTGFGQDRATSAVEKALERVERALEREKALAPETKDALRDLIQALRMERGWDPRPTQGVQETRAAVSKSEITKVVDSHLADRIDPPQEPAWKEVLSRLTFYGDLRLRHESSFRLDEKPARHRERVRFRFGANYQLSNEVLLGGRITTGNPADPQSPHVTLGNVFHSFDMTLDRAFLNYRPTWMPEVDLTAGKFSHPFTINPVYSELVWDADVQPEGFVGRYSISEAGGLERLDFLAGAYILLEQGTAEDTLASVFQLSSRFRLADQLRTNLALGYYRYADATPEGSLSIFKENSGNAVVDTDGDGKPDDFQSRFGILNPIVGLTYDGWKFPLTFSGEYILNTHAGIDEDQGWALGAALGRAQRQGDWRLYYQWQVVEQDAVFSALSQDDFLFQTNHRSHLFGVNNQLTDKIALHLWGLVSEREKTFSGLSTDSDKNQWRFRLDMNIRF